VVDVGRWGNKVEVSRLEMQCFKAAWVANVLHDGIGMPRIVDPGGNDSTHGDEVAAQAKNKGLGKPTFQSLDSVGDIAISWTLGKMVLEASKEVPPLSKSNRPLVDPLDDIPDSAHNPIRPIRPPFLDFDLIEDHISQHLPSSLTRKSLGFSPVVLMLSLLLISVLVSVTYRLRHQLRASFRRFRRGARWRDRDIASEGHAMEEGKAANAYIGNSRPSSPSTFLPSVLLRPLQLIPCSRLRLHPISTLSPKPKLRHVSSAHASPTTSSSPTLQYQNGISRSSSPSNQYFEDGTIANSISSLSRSRNASQMNLTTLVPRQITMSRTNSASYVPDDSSFMDE